VAKKQLKQKTGKKQFEAAKSISEKNRCSLRPYGEF